jgi:hypothetical protein
VAELEADGMRTPAHDPQEETAPDLAPVNRGKPRR